MSTASIHLSSVTKYEIVLEEFTEDNLYVILQVGDTELAIHFPRSSIGIAAWRSARSAIRGRDYVAYTDAGRIEDPAIADHDAELYAMRYGARAA